MTTYTYEFTAFTEDALLNAGSGNGSNLGYGDSFTMPTSADVTFAVTDDDPYLSGDSQNNENANDSSYQTATITIDGEEVGNGGQVYGEQYFWVQGSSGNWYVMIEIEQEGAGDDYFTFYNAYGVPEAGETLTVSCGGNISCWEPHMGCLESPPATTPPVAVLDAITITEGESIGDNDDDAQLNILANDFDTDGTISLTGVNGAAPGDVVTVTTEGGVAVDVTVDASGNLFFDTGADFNTLLDGQSDSFELTYTITDNDGNAATSTVTVTIEGESSIDAVDDEYTVFEDEGAGSVQGNVLDNDTNDFGSVDAVLRVQGQEANVGEWIDLAEGGRVRLDENGEIDFDADGDFDSLNDGDSAMVNLTYTIAYTDGGTTDEYQCLFFGGHSAGTTIDNQYTQNGVTISGYRSHDANQADPANAVMIFDTANPTGGDLDLSSSTRGNVLIISEDFNSANPDDEAHGGTFVFDFDREADVESIIFLDTEEPTPVIRLYDENDNLISTMNGPSTADGEEGIANINVDGVYRMEVELQGSGAIDNLIYTLKGETQIVEEDTANVKINILGIDDPNVLDDGDEAASVDEGSGATVLVVNALDNTFDPDGGTPVVTAIVAAAGSNGGTFSIDENGVITFDTNDDFNTLAEGDTATTTITYTVTDGQGGSVDSTVTVTVNGVNDLADGDETAEVFEDSGITALSTNALDNVVDPDSDPNDIKIATLAGVALVAGMGIAAGSDGGEFTFDEDGNVSFNTLGDFDVLEPGEVTTTSITYQVSDGDGGLVTSTYTVEVTGVNDAPVAVANSYAINEGEALTSANIINDADQSSDVGEVDSDPNGDALTINSALGNDVDGNMTVNIVSSTFVTVYTDGGVAVEVKLDAAGNLEVSENSDVDAAGDQITLKYTVEDIPAAGVSKVSNEATVTVSIADVPDPAGPEINVVFLLDASIDATSADSSAVLVGDLNNDGKANSNFDLSIDVMLDAIANISDSLGAGSHDVDIGIFSFESQITAVANEFTPAVALQGPSGEVFNANADFNATIGEVTASLNSASIPFGDNGSDIFDNGAAFMAAAMEAANGFISTNDQSGTSSDAINLVYVIGSSIGVDKGNDYFGAAGPGMDGNPDGFLSADYLLGLPGANPGDPGPFSGIGLDSSSDVALTNALLESEDLGLLVDTLYFGSDTVAFNSGLFALENFQPDLVTFEPAIGDGTINTDPTTFLNGVTAQIDDLLV